MGIRFDDERRGLELVCHPTTSERDARLPELLQRHLEIIPVEPPKNAGQQASPTESYFSPSRSLIIENLDLTAKGLDWTGELLDAWILEKKEEQEANREDGNGFNPYSKISIREIDHSRLIGDLLNPSGSHGQGTLFLYAFLRHLSIPEFEKGDWKISVETGRVDIMLWRDQPMKSAVLIENKSNNAVDQSNQIYRYWYEQLYLWDKCLWDPTTSEQDQVRRRRFQVIYLTTDTGRKPSTHSLQCPEKLKSLNLPDPLPLEVKTISLSNLTKLWIDEADPPVPESNTRLRSFLKQYHEIWNPMNEHDMTARSVKIFDKLEKWDAFFQIQDEIEKIIEHWRLIGAQAIRAQFKPEHNRVWTCAEWGNPKDTRWYLAELGPESIGIGFGWEEMELDIFFHWESLGKYDLKLAVQLLATEQFSKIRQIFPDNANRPKRLDDGCFASDENFTPYPEATDPVARRRVFAWHAAHEPGKFAKEIAEKIRSIIEDEEITKLIRSLNSLSLRSHSGSSDSGPGDKA